MLNRYWREYPWYFQLTQYILFLFIFGSLFTGVITPLLASRVQDETARIWFAQGISNLGTFAIPALIFAYVVHPRPAHYLGFRLPGRPVHWLLVAALVLGAMPLVQGLTVAMQQLNFGAGANQIQATYTKTMAKMVDLRTPGQFVLALLVTGLVAPLGEEMTFRGVLLRFSARRARSMMFPVLVTAVMFSLFHFSNIYALLPIALMGVIMALIVYWTGSLWCSIFGHLLFNATQVIALYLADKSERTRLIAEQETPSVLWLIGGAVLFVAALVGLYRMRTPLPHNWAADFSPEELAAREEELQQRMRL